MPTRDQILEALKVVIDPELHRSIVELGMVRAIEISEQGAVNVTVSLTTPGCPIKGHFQSGVTKAVKSVEGVTDAKVDIVWEPQWTKDRMSDAAKLQLGMW